MDAADLSALSALFGSAIGVLASLETTWLTQRYQDRSQRMAQERARLRLRTRSWRALLRSIICPTWISQRGQARRMATSTFSGISQRHAALS